MVAQSRFRGRVFWISYAGFVVLWVLIGGIWGRPLDHGGTMSVLCSIIFPVPFVLLGYFARRVSFCILYALVVLVISYVIFFYGFALLDHALGPPAQVIGQPN